MDSKEQIELIVAINLLNTMLEDVLSTSPPPEYQTQEGQDLAEEVASTFSINVSVHAQGTIVTFLGAQLWHSEDDDREYLPMPDDVLVNEDEYLEPFFGYLETKMLAVLRLTSDTANSSLLSLLLAKAHDKHDIVSSIVPDDDTTQPITTRATTTSLPNEGDNEGDNRYDDHVFADGEFKARDYRYSARYIDLSLRTILDTQASYCDGYVSLVYYDKSESKPTLHLADNPSVLAGSYLRATTTKTRRTLSSIRRDAHHADSKSGDVESKVTEVLSVSPKKLADAFRLELINALRTYPSHLDSRDTEGYKSILRESVEIAVENLGFQDIETLRSYVFAL